MLSTAIKQGMTRAGAKVSSGATIWLIVVRGLRDRNGACRRQRLVRSLTPHPITTIVYRRQRTCGVQRKPGAAHGAVRVVFFLHESHLIRHFLHPPFLSAACTSRRHSRQQQMNSVIDLERSPRPQTFAVPVRVAQPSVRNTRPRRLTLERQQ